MSEQGRLRLSAAPQHSTARVGCVCLGEGVDASRDFPSQGPREGCSVCTWRRCLMLWHDFAWHGRRGTCQPGGPLMYVPCNEGGVMRAGRAGRMCHRCLPRGSLPAAHQSIKRITLTHSSARPRAPRRARRWWRRPPGAPLSTTAGASPCSAPPPPPAHRVVHCRSSKDQASNRLSPGHSPATRAARCFLQEAYAAETTARREP